MGGRDKILLPPCLRLEKCIQVHSRMKAAGRSPGWWWWWWWWVWPVGVPHMPHHHMLLLCLFFTWPLIHVSYTCAYSACSAPFLAPATASGNEALPWREQPTQEGWHFSCLRVGGRRRWRRAYITPENLPYLSLTALYLPMTYDNILLNRWWSTSSLPSLPAM